MKFLILGTIGALLCYYAYTQDDNDLNREDIDLQLEQEIIHQPLLINQNQETHKQGNRNIQPAIPSPEPQKMAPVEVTYSEPLIVQEIAPEKDKKRSENAPKIKSNDNNVKQSTNSKQQRRTSTSQEPGSNGRKNQKRQNVYVKTPSEKPKPEFKPLLDSKTKEKQKYKPPKQPKQQFPKVTPNKNAPPTQQYKGKVSSKKDKTQGWYSQVMN